MRYACLICLVLLAGCEIETASDAATALPPDPAEAPRADGRTDAERDALEAGARGADVVTAESPDADIPVASVETYALRRLVLGDRACYLDLQADGEDTETRLADFGVCSQAEVEDLLGKRVRLEVGRANVMAESCEGDPECEDVESVQLITRLYAAE